MIPDKEVVGYLLFKKVNISNANSLSSPLTYGFPAVTGFLGAFHAISRRLMIQEGLQDYSLGGVLLACYDCQPQIYRTSPYSNYTFNQTRNPIKKDGSTASIIEEGKCHLTMSFVVEVLGDLELSDDETQLLVDHSQQWIQQHRIAGGSVHGLDKHNPVTFIKASDIETLSPLLMPAFVLMDASDDFTNIINELQASDPEMTPLDALIDVCTLHHSPEPILKHGEPTGGVTWRTTSVKSGRGDGGGWLVPMPIGYQGISPVFAESEMVNSRNPEYPSQYVESVYGLGKWVYPQRLQDDFKRAFWRYHYDVDNALYLVHQSNQ